MSFHFSDVPPLSAGMRFRLSAMMFLQSAAPGAFMAVLGNRLSHLGFCDTQIGAIYSTWAIGTLISPLLFGQCADRFFHSERLLGVLHTVNAVLLLVMSQLTAESRLDLLGGVELAGVDLFFAVSLLTALNFQPTWVMSYTVAFRHLPDTARDMPGIRVMGTISWMLVNLAVGNLLGPDADTTGKPLQLGAAMSVAQALLAFSVLPATPPTGHVGDAVPFVRAVRLLVSPGFCVLLPVCLLSAVATAFYYPYTAGYLREQGFRDPAGTLALGQLVEMLAMPLIAYAVLGVGLRAVLAVGLACWAVRYGLFALGATGGTADPVAYIAVLTGVALHGPCIAFFREAALILVRLKTPDSIRGSATALYLFLVDGVGTFLGSWISGAVLHHYARGDSDVGPSHDWSVVWLVPAGIAGTALLGLLVLFRVPPDPVAEPMPVVEPASEAPPATAQAVTAQAVPASPTGLPARAP